MMHYTNHAATTPTRYVNVGDRQFAYRRFGVAGGTPLVGFQHFTGTMDNWDPIILNGLARDREVIIFDNAGVGNSEGTTPTTVAEMAHDVVAFIHAIGLPTFDVLGFSLGGFIAQHLAFYHPTLVRKLIMVGTAPQGAAVLNTFQDLIARAMQKDAAERFLFIFFTPTERSRQQGKATLERLAERKEDHERETIPASVAAQAKAIIQWGTGAPDIALFDIPHPVMIVQGSKDEMMDSATSYELFQQLPNAILSYYPDSAHGSFYQYPDLFVNQASFFLDHY